jgi:hypothetical protein
MCLPVTCLYSDVLNGHVYSMLTDWDLPLGLLGSHVLHSPRAFAKNIIRIDTIRYYHCFVIYLVYELFIYIFSNHEVTI